MTGVNSTHIDRRTLLKLTGGVGIGAIAGCLGDPDDDGDGEEFDELTITLSQFPDTIDPLDHITGDYFDVYDHIYKRSRRMPRG